MIKACIFDLDGTLVDSEPLYVQGVRDALAFKNIDVSEAEAFDIVHGHAWSLIYKTSQGLYPGSWDKSEDMWRFVENRAIELSKTLDIAIANSIEKLIELSNEYPIAVVSGSPREKIERNLIETGIIDYVDFYMGCEDYEHSKPNPEPFLKAIDRLGLKAEECLIFEDSPAGINSAKAAGSPVVILTEEPDHELSDGAYAVLSSLKDFSIK